EILAGAPAMRGRDDESASVILRVRMRNPRQVLRHLKIAEQRQECADVRGLGRTQDEPPRLQNDRHVSPRSRMPREKQKGRWRPISLANSVEPPSSWRPVFSAAYSAASVTGMTDT